MGSRTGRFAIVAIVAAVLGVSHVGTATAAPGDVLRNIAAGVPGGVSVAFDGSRLYYTDLNGTLLHSVAPDGTGQTTAPIVGAPGINALTYDSTHDFFWGVDATGLGVYQVTRNGIASLQFALIPALDLPGLCDSVGGCSTVVSGLAYDATTDSLWFAPQLSQRIYHLTTAGDLLGSVDTNDAPGSLFPECPANGVSGLAAGADSLYLGAGTCGSGFRYAKSDTQTATKLSSFAVEASSAGDVECDDRTFSATVLWVRDASAGRLRAIEVAPGTCTMGGGVAPNLSNGWFSGSGRPLDALNALPVQHAFHIICNQVVADGPPNNMVVNWKDAQGNSFSFHLNTVTTLECFYDGGVGSSPPPCDPVANPRCFNKIIGSGTGKLKGRKASGEPVLLPCSDCGQVDFTFTDRGEPSRIDEGELFVNDLRTGTNLVAVACICTDAKYQAHNQQLR